MRERSWLLDVGIPQRSALYGMHDIAAVESSPPLFNTHDKYVGCGGVVVDVALYGIRPSHSFGVESSGSPAYTLCSSNDAA